VQCDKYNGRNFLKIDERPLLSANPSIPRSTTKSDLISQVSREVFRRVLSQFDLYLREDSSLNMFLARCGLPETGDISYVNFLNKFQDRSEEGMAHNILSNPQHRYRISFLVILIWRRVVVTIMKSNVVNKLQAEYCLYHCVLY